MVDPVGAPTFAQLFSPTKSPFHAISLFSLVCIYASSASELFSYSYGICIFILVLSLALAPFFQPNYDNRTYGLSFMYGRAAGIIGGLVAITILVSGSVANHIVVGGNGSTINQENLNKLSSDSPTFILIWRVALAHTLFWIMMLGFKTKTITKKGRAYNIIQFSLIESTIVIFLCAISTKIGYLDIQYDSYIIQKSLFSIVFSPLSFFIGSSSEYWEILYIVLTLWIFYSAINMFSFLSKVRLGWVRDHGDGEIN